MTSTPSTPKSKSFFTVKASERWSRVRLLVDTHIVLWRMLSDSRLPASAIAQMDDPANEVVVSVVSVWEVSVKHALTRAGQPALPISGGEFRSELLKVGVMPMPITADHVVALDDIPLHHRDPFDRLLVAQAQAEGMVLLTHDAQLAAYGDLVLVV